MPVTARAWTNSQKHAKGDRVLPVSGVERRRLGIKRYVDSQAKLSQTTLKKIAHSPTVYAPIRYAG